MGGEGYMLDMIRRLSEGGKRPRSSNTHHTEQRRKRKRSG